MSLVELPASLEKKPVPREHAPTRKVDHRPWGKFEQFVLNELCSVKVITVEPQQRLSLQSHALRSEWWMVLDGRMQVEIGGDRLTLGEGDEIFIPRGQKHRASGLDGPCRWLEIAFGTFDELDIRRYEDAYGRR